MGRVEHRKLEQDLENYKRLTQSWQYSEIADETRDTFNAELSALETMVAAKKKELNGIVFRLRDTDFWPVIPKPQDTSVADAETLKNIQELKTGVGDLYRKIQELEQRTASIAQEVTPEGGERAPKRRRLSTTSPGDALPTISHPQPPSRWSSEVESRLDELDERYTSLENNLVVYDNDMLLRVNEQVEQKLEETLPLLQGMVPTQAPVAIPPDGLAGLESDVGAIAGYVTELYHLKGTTDEQVGRLAEENVQLKQKITLLETSQKQVDEALMRDRAEIKALKTALTSLLAQTASPPIPTHPSKEDIITSIKPQIVQAIQSDVQPMFSGLQKTIEAMLEKQRSDLPGIVMTNFKPSMQPSENGKHVPHVNGTSPLYPSKTSNG